MGCQNERTATSWTWLVLCYLAPTCLNTSGVKLFSPPHILNTLPARVFGCVIFVHLPKNQRSKLDARALKCVFVGYGTYQNGYKCYHPPTQKFFVTMDVSFFEDACYFSSTEAFLQGEKYTYFEEKSSEHTVTVVPSETAKEAPDVSGVQTEKGSVAR